MFDRVLDKIDEYKNRPYFEQFHDIRAIGLLIFLFIILLMSWSGVKVIQTNYDLQKQISELQQENKVQQLTNANMKLRNDYLNSNQYLELAARQNFGKGNAGETELIVPTAVALKHITEDGGKKAATPTTKQPFYQRNFQAWINFFLHRQGDS